MFGWPGVLDRQPLHQTAKEVNRAIGAGACQNDSQDASDRGNEFLTCRLEKQKVAEQADPERMTQILSVHLGTYIPLGYGLLDGAHQEGPLALTSTTVHRSAKGVRELKSDAHPPVEVCPISEDEDGTDKIFEGGGSG